MTSDCLPILMRLFWCPDFRLLTLALFHGTILELVPPICPIIKRACNQLLNPTIPWIHSAVDRSPGALFLPPSTRTINAHKMISANGSRQQSGRRCKERTSLPYTHSPSSKVIYQMCLCSLFFFRPSEPL